MNEHQLDYHSDFHNSDIASEQQHLSSDLTGDYNQDSLTNSMELELTPHQPWEQPDHSDYSQPDWNVTQDSDYYSYSESETYSTSSGSDVSESNIAYSDSQSSIYDQSTYSVEQNSFDNALDTQDYNNNLWEQQFQEQSTSSYGGVSFNEQRSGHDPTAEDLQKANELDAQAREAETHYQDDTNWAKNLENENHPDASNYYESAADYKAKAEDLQAEADKLRE